MKNLGVTMHQRLILALDATRLELTDKVGLGFKSLGHHQQATGVLVEPMHDACTGQNAETGAVMQQRIEQRARPVATTGVDNEPHRLVDDKQRVVLVEDVQRNVLRTLGKHRLGWFRADQHDLPAPHLGLGIRRGTVDEDPPGLEPGLKPAAGMFGKQSSECLIDPKTGTVVRNRLALRRRGRDRWAIIDPIFFQ